MPPPNSCLHTGAGDLWLTCKTDHVSSLIRIPLKCPLAYSCVCLKKSVLTEKWQNFMYVISSNWFSFSLLPTAFYFSTLDDSKSPFFSISRSYRHQAYQILTMGNKAPNVFHFHGTLGKEPGLSLAPILPQSSSIWRGRWFHNQKDCAPWVTQGSRALLPSTSFSIDQKCHYWKLMDLKKKLLLSKHMNIPTFTFSKFVCSSNVGGLPVMTS